MSTTAVDEKLKKYRTIQEGTNMRRVLVVLFAHHDSICHSPLQSFFVIDIQKLFVQKQNALSQFNENTLVRGVSACVYLSC